ncbi:putative RING-H2 finger protein ATL21B [Chenopodium quinoa]|uniref:putative RING-H2 finger protein ATL21B n=1 Tax=Chenopodium quinoa TaxID=63459 RepID=UPI000B784910|nr:putative RING-H2 finger protein ATL21B [Chenopodium quinoa]
MDLNTLIIVLLFFLLTLISNFPYKVMSNNCSISKCGDFSGSPTIRFPFRIKSSGKEEPDSCGHPGFDVWCDEGSKSSLIELPRSGNFSIKSIDYVAQEMWINDPNNCLPKKLLTFNLSNSPFVGIYHQYFSFFNCSKTLNTTKNNTTNNLKGLIGPIKCLSGSHHFIYAIPSNGTNNNHPSNCSLIAPLVKVPVQWPPSLHNNNTNSSLSSELHDDLRLSWYMPECRPCELNGQMCGLKTNNNNGSQVIICSNNPNQGMVGKLPITTFIAVILVICSPTLICLVGSLIIWIRACLRHRSLNRDLQLESVVTNGPDRIGELGLAELNIEFAMQVVRLGQNEEASPEYRPTIVISEIEEVGQGPNSENENACAICMGEYIRKDRIGTLPVCGHYFHANCVNKWLLSRGRFGKTCPICRTPVDSS